VAAALLADVDGIDLGYVPGLVGGRTTLLAVSFKFVIVVVLLL